MFVAGAAGLELALLEFPDVDDAEVDAPEVDAPASVAARGGVNVRLLELTALKYCAW